MEAKEQFKRLGSEVLEHFTEPPAEQEAVSGEASDRCFYPLTWSDLHGQVTPCNVDRTFHDMKTLNHPFTEAQPTAITGEALRNAVWGAYKILINEPDAVEAATKASHILNSAFTEAALATQPIDLLARDYVRLLDEVGGMREALRAIAGNALVDDPAWVARDALGDYSTADIQSAPDWFKKAAEPQPEGER